MELQLVLSANQPITFDYDNSGAIAESKEPKYHKRQKYIAKKYHLIHDFIERWDIVADKIASGDKIYLEYPFKINIEALPENDSTWLHI